MSEQEPERHDDDQDEGPGSAPSGAADQETTGESEDPDAGPASEPASGPQDG